MRTIFLLGLVAISILGVFAYYSLQTKQIDASDFTLTDINGKAIRLRDFRGKIIVINFISIWCGSCKLQIPELEAVKEKYGDKIVIMTIDLNIRETEDALKTYAQQFPYATWIWALDKENLAETYKITAIPTTIIIDERGQIVFSHIGVTDGFTLIYDIDHMTA